MPPKPRDEAEGADALGEAFEVWHNRYNEARDAGLTVHQAALFADSSADIGELRRLVRSGCDPHLIARIVL